MKKEVLRGYFNSQDGKVNLAFIIAVMMIFLLSLVFVQAMTINLITPKSYTFNTTGNRNINFSFNTSWFFGGADPKIYENVSNCSLYTNTTFGTWDIVKNVSPNNMGNDNLIVNYTNNDTTLQTNKGAGNISYMNYTFTRDGNFTFGVACYNFTNSSGEGLTFAANFSFFLDSSVPGINYTSPFSNGTNNLTNFSWAGARSITFQVNDSGSGLNLSKNNSINVSIRLGGTEVAFFAYLNDTGTSSNLTCGAASSAITQSMISCNVTYNFAGDGIYLVNSSAQDALLQGMTSAIKTTVDRIAPVINSFNITNGSADGAITLGSSNVSQVPVVGDGTWRQGRALRFFANVSDNLTQPLAAEVQFYNVSANGGAGAWQTIADTSNTSNYLANSNISNSNLTIFPTNITITAGLGPNTTGMVNLTFTPSIGRGVFEGHNITFRIVVNDTLGNRDNNSRFVSLGNASFGNATNITIQINDTTKPTISVYIGSESSPLNNSNVSTPTPIVIWNVSESNQLRYVAVQFDSLTSQPCNSFRNFTQSNSDVEDNRNGTLTLSDAGSCPDLANGSHTVRVTAEDVWGNMELYIHQFYVQGGKPGLIFNGLTRSDSLGLGGGVNNTNLTSKMGLNFTAFGGAVNIRNLTYVSSCNSSSTVAFLNDSVIFPFNESTCPTTSSNVTLTVTVTDNVGNSNSTVFGFTLDNVAPSLTVNSPASTQRFANIGNVSVLVNDSESRVDSIGFFIDGDVNIYRNHSSNGSSSSLTEDFGRSFISNSTLNNSIGNLTPGTHTIKLTVNDTLGNSRNSSIITFTVSGPINFVSLGFFNTTSNSTTNLFVRYNGGNLSNVTLTNDTGVDQYNETRDVTDQTLRLFMGLNYTTKGINLTLYFNATAANWNRYNFSVKQNDSDFINYILTNYSVETKDLVWVNESIQDFLANNNSYYGIISYPLNISAQSPGANFAIWYFNDSKVATKKLNVTQCSSSFIPALADSSSEPCWNTTTNSSISIFVPHFSAIAIVNDSGAPTANVTIPVANQSVSMFRPNISVSLDAVACYSSLNGTQANATMAFSTGRCVGQTERLKNMDIGDSGVGYNFSFWVVDSEGNTNRYIWNFNISDTTAPGKASISSSPSTTSATVTVTGENETVNITVLYGTVNTTLGSSATNTGFNNTASVSLSSLTASTTYYYNVTRCDFNGNCVGNGTFSFTTTAASSSSSSSSSSGGGGSAGATPTTPSNAADSSTRSWDTLAADSTGTFNVKSDNIALTSVAIAVANTVSNPSVTVNSLKSNPQTSVPSEKVFQYLEIKHTNIADSDIKSATITFKVPKSWLSSNNIAEADIVLYRYNSGQWNALSTKATTSDDSNVWFEAVTPGFSDYAIGTKSASAAPAEAGTTPSEEPAATGEQPTPAEPTAAPQSPSEEPSGKNKVAWIVVAVIVVVLAILFVLWQKKKSQA